MTNNDRSIITAVETFAAHPHRGAPVMRDWNAPDRTVIKARVAARLAEAANERLAKANGATANGTGLRRHAGLLLIRVGRRIAGEATPGAAPAKRRQGAAAA